MKKPITPQSSKRKEMLISNDRFYLNCPYDKKDDCKSLGVWWDNDGYEPTFKEAKDQFEFWLEHFVEYAEMDNCHFKWKYKNGREPGVLAYLILGESEQRKFKN